MALKCSYFARYDVAMTKVVLQVLASCWFSLICDVNYDVQVLYMWILCFNEAKSELVEIKVDSSRQWWSYDMWRYVVSHDLR